MKRFVYIFSVILNVIFILLFSVFVYRKGGIGYLMFKANKWFKQSEKRNVLYYKNKNSIYNVLKTKNECIVFLGNSIIERCPWNELLKRNDVINRGIGGDTSLGVLRRIGSICRIKPKKVFIMIGINDINQGTPISTIANNINVILKKLKKIKTTVYVLSILPVNNYLYGYDISNDKIKKLNCLIKERCKQNLCFYIDLTNYFSDENGNLKKELTTDGLHLNGSGYLILKKVLKPYIDN